MGRARAEEGRTAAPLDAVEERLPRILVHATSPSGLRRRGSALTGPGRPAAGYPPARPPGALRPGALRLGEGHPVTHGVLGHHARLDEAQEVVRAAGLGARPREAAAPEGLPAHLGSG